ncbi:hypothetical protein [Pararcticibacter amylolyticus]|uniref:Uncharacterized protein n=1 Tax=Pararcticibacter amylolyticus TaxID=2173175 RepID=A0A2U2PHA6_9SPHI|nr:hypothetical protein [Pararcticibacter amylolyticus]PWG80805.1 hypothetical protein DDR33_10130 [Pararcticibacter amylolyticus]
MWSSTLKTDSSLKWCAVFIILFGLAMSLFGGCQRHPQVAFSGTYVNQAKSEFSIASDTLAVEKIQEENYIIRRKTGIRMLNESGKPGKLILESEEWKAIYDPEQKVMTGQQKGRLIRFSADGLLLENSLYRRIP